MAIKTKKDEEKRNNIKFFLILFLILITGVILIYSTYAWFSSSLNVQIYGFNVHVDHDSDLAISLDGTNWKQSVNISKDSLVKDLLNIYPNHTNRWSDYMSTVSTIGLLDNGYKFSVFSNDAPFSNNGYTTDYIYPRRIDESKPTLKSNYFAFDIFIKNNTGSPYNDNLYITNEKDMFIPDSSDDEFILNAIRFGMVYVGTTSKNASLSEIQNMSCNTTECKYFIYEPSVKHTDGTIKMLESRGISIKKDSIIPTYAVYREADKVNLWSGIYNSKLDFNDNTFAFQNTITDLSNSVFELPSGISKYRIYIWVEGEDVDVIKTSSPGYRLIFGIDFRKDNAGYR